MGTTIYHGFYTKLEQRFSRGLSYLVSYTRSKLMDDASSVFDASILTGPVASFPVADGFNRTLERDYSAGDIPHVLVASAVWDIPGNWTLTGVLTVQSGTPLAVTQTTNNNAFAGFGTQRPNLAGDPTLPRDERSPDRWFNTGAFSAAPAFTIGSSSGTRSWAGLPESRPRGDPPSAAPGLQGRGSTSGGLQPHEHAAVAGAEHDGRVRGVRDDHRGRQSSRRATGREARVLNYSVGRLF